METFSTIVGILLVGLLIALFWTIVRFPKDIFKGLLRSLTPNPLGPVLAAEEAREQPYPSIRNLRFDFEAGEKSVWTDEPLNILSEIVQAFVEFTTHRYADSDFEVMEDGLIRCPSHMSFYDFNLLVQHFGKVSGNSRGVFESGELSFYVYQDPWTSNNLIGRTSDGEAFSIHMLDDLNARVWLRLNPKLEVAPMKA